MFNCIWRITFALKRTKLDRKSWILFIFLGFILIIIEKTIILVFCKVNRTKALRKTLWFDISCQSKVKKHLELNTLISKLHWNKKTYTIRDLIDRNKQHRQKVISLLSVHGDNYCFLSSLLSCVCRWQIVQSMQATCCREGERERNDQGHVIVKIQFKFYSVNEIERK